MKDDFEKALESYLPLMKYIQQNSIGLGKHYGDAALDHIKEFTKENERLKEALYSAFIVMQYYDRNKCIHPMLNDFAAEWLEINKEIINVLK